MNKIDQKYDQRSPVFNGSQDENFYLWSLRDSLALESRELETALSDGEADRSMDKKAMTIIISSLGKNPLREIHH